MISLRFAQLAAWTGGTLRGSDNGDKSFAGVAIDSRLVRPGELFIAIRGENHDGHDFIGHAVSNGAAAVLSESAYPGPGRMGEDIAVVSVVDSHEAMLRLAGNYRDSLDARFVGITGSNGKTTTKEFAYRLIGTVEENTYGSPGNFNNLYGVPLALFSVAKEAKVAVLELGISTAAEMPRLADMVHPELIAITNIGPSHLQFLDSVEAVARTKLELVRRADPSVPVILNADDPLLMQEARKIREDFVTFSLERNADYRVESIARDESGTTVVTIQGDTFRLPLIGKHQVYNLLAAYAVFRTLGYDFANVDTADISLDTAPMRGQRLDKNGITFIADCYNANPESVEAGLEAFFQIPTDGRRVVILGDMLELGTEAETYHRAVGEILARREFELAVTVGPLSEHIMNEATSSGKPRDIFRHFEDARAAARAAAEYLQKGDFVFIKGSRGIGLEAVLDALDGCEEED